MPNYPQKLSIISTAKNYWEGVLWNAEKVDYPIADAINNANMKTQAVKNMKDARIALEKLEVLLKEINEEAEAEKQEAAHGSG